MKTRAVLLSAIFSCALIPVSCTGNANITSNQSGENKGMCVAKGELSRYDLRGPVKTMQEELDVVVSFDRDGLITSIDGKPVDEYFDVLVRDASNRIVMDSYVVCDSILGPVKFNDDTVICEPFTEFEVFKYDGDGRLSQYDHIKGSRLAAGPNDYNIMTVTFVYSADGYVIKEMLSLQEGREGSIEYTDLEFDHHGNWIERKWTHTGKGRTKSGIDRRTITYY